MGCMNGMCGATSSIEWKKGWPLRSGEFASLCDKCGSVYEQLIFCDVFHAKDTGWRECTSCGKRLHCGCIASSTLLELLDSGGISCISCTKSSEHKSTLEKLKGCGVPVPNIVDDIQSTSVANQLNAGNGETKLTQFGGDAAGIAQKHMLPSKFDTTNRSLYQIKPEEFLPPMVEGGNISISNVNQASVESPQDAKLDMYKAHQIIKDTEGSMVQTNLSISLSAPSGSPNLFSGSLADERELYKTISSFQQGSRSRHLLSRPPKPNFTAGLESNGGTIVQMRVARPPVEGRVKNQLLPRYWPRITDQELQQISGDSNSTIVPLFEKVLSASDAGRIGRLVLPKACAEAYFPPISQPEGLPLRIQDVKGKEWVFQFRFWPNNNSRMYVLEGVTPCIQSMQLQAGDTVTFSRMDPEGKLLMGFRKATNITPMQDPQSAMPNGTFSGGAFFSAATENLPLISGYSGLLQSLKGSRDSSLNVLSKHLNGGDYRLHAAPKHGIKTSDGSLTQSVLLPERKRNRNIGSKSKRLLIDSQDALELKISWEEVQDMLRPPPSVKPSTVTIEDHEFEEYEEPPVFGKRSIFTVRLSGEGEQWAQCDDCFKWRRLPADFLLPTKWTCQENIWDHARCLCSAPDELSPKELENLLKMNKDFRKQSIAKRIAQTNDSSDLDTLANVAASGGDVSESGTASVATTTKHPRHRPGCSCIVCIQPPSGKGKHKPNCACNVCMTVKRRFKTLMMRKKKRQSEREAEVAQRNRLLWSVKDDTEVDSIPAQVISQLEVSEQEGRSRSELKSRDQNENNAGKCVDMGKGQLDLNYHPGCENLPMSSSCMSMTSLVQEASLPLETYLRQNGLTSLVSEQQTSSGSYVLPQATGESEEQLQGDCNLTPMVVEQEKHVTEELSEPDESGSDPS